MDDIPTNIAWKDYHKLMIPSADYNKLSRVGASNMQRSSEHVPSIATVTYHM